MFYALRKDCFFRQYGEIGHIIRPAVSAEEILNEGGAIFVAQLGYEPRNIDNIVDNLLGIYAGIDEKELKNDALTLFNALALDGFLDKSDSLENFVHTNFSYATLEGRLAKDIIKTNVKESSSDFFSRYSLEHPFLDSFQIELTSKCNERCVHCYIPHEIKNTQIEHDLMIKALDECKAMGVLTIVFSGGEAMLHPNFCEFLKYAKDLDLNVVVLSNLTLLNDGILEALKYRHPSCVNVSLYSMNPEVHDSITTIKGSQEITKKNIIKLIENNIPVQINCPVMKQNKDDFDEVVRWGQGYKCSVVVDYLIMARCDRSTDNLQNRLSSAEVEQVITKLLNSDVVFQTNIKNRDESKLGKHDGNERVCGVGLTSLCMISNGDVYPCVGWHKCILGNLNNNSLNDIWNNSPQIKYLRGLRMRDFKKCNGCKDYDYCLMCMSRNSNEDPDGDIFNIPQITCDAAEIHHKVVEVYRSQMKGG